MSELPPGWALAPLEACVDILDSRRIPLNADERKRRNAGKKDDVLYPYYGATGRVGSIDEFLFDEPLILLGEDGAPFLDRFKKKAYTVEGKLWVNNHAHVIRARAGIADRGYVAAYLNAFDYTDSVTGSTRLKLTQAAMRAIPVPLAPLNEQARIGDKLDAVLVRVDACRARLDRVPAILERFREAVLEAAVSGRLTEEWRLDKGVAPDWLETTVGEVTKQIQYGVTASGRPGDTGPRLLRITDVQGGRVDWSAVPGCFISASEVKRFSLAEGDIVIARTGGTIGKSFLVRHVPTTAVFASYLIRLVSKNVVEPAYLHVFLNSPDYWMQLKEMSRGAAQPNVNATSLATLALRLPSIPEQREIVRRVDELFVLADGLERKYGEAVERVERITPAVLAKAFRGELVPQDPGDEPAEKLLERIRAARESVGSTARSSRTRAKTRAPVMRIARRAKK